MYNDSNSYRELKVCSDSKDCNIWGIAEEVAVEIAINGNSWTVLMASPDDLADLAFGLAVTEGIVSWKNCTKLKANVSKHIEGWIVDIEISDNILDAKQLRRRSMVGLSGCGLCGLERLADTVRYNDRFAKQGNVRANNHKVTSDAIKTAFADLSKHQTLNQKTKTVHGAAWVDVGGNIQVIREDIGRHNALDKLVGALAQVDQTNKLQGFIIMSSRCSFELILKAAITNTSLLATVSAPTSMAIDIANNISLPIMCIGEKGRIVSFNHDNDT